MKKIIILCALLFVTSAAQALNVGDNAPAFRLPGADGKNVKLSDYSGRIVVLEWINPGCPYVKKHYNSGHMQKLQQELVAKGVVWLTINSTNSEHSDFVAAERRAEFVQEKKMANTAYLTDADGVVGQLYSAKTTPHLFVIDSAGKVAYQGAIDDTPMGDPAAAKNYVSDAVNELIAGKAVSEPETRPYGCSVKY